VTGLVIDGTAALVTLIGEGTRLLVMAGLLWAGGDLTLLLIDAGHDLRVARILLGRINTQLHANSTAGRPGAAPGVLRPAQRPPSGQWLHPAATIGPVAEAAQAPVDPKPPAPRPLGAIPARVKRTRATGCTRSWATRSPGAMARGSGPWLTRTTFTFAAVIAVDHAGQGVDAVAHGEPAPRPHQADVTGRDLDEQAGGDGRPTP